MQNVGDLDNAFRLYVDKADSQGAADFLVGERARFLNDAQLRLARELVNGKPDNQDAVDLRRTLSSYAELTVGNGPEASGSAVFPEDYLAFGRLRIQLKQPYHHYTVKPTIVSEDELSNVLDDEFNRPTIGEPVVCFLYNRLLVYPRASSDIFLLSYYHLPAELDLGNPSQVPDLAPALLPTLVQYAVQLALESVADPRFQTQAAVAKVTAIS